VLVVCIFTTSLAGFAGCRSGGIRVESWDEAIAYTQAELAKSGDLEGRLSGYDRTAAQHSANIDLLDQAQPALQLIDDLRDVQVPLIGNGWQILLALLSLASVDGAKIITRLEETLRSLGELKHSLDYLNALPETVDAVRAFRTEPTRRKLSTLYWASKSATPSMWRLHAELGEVLVPIEDVADNFSGLMRGLSSAADADVPVVSDAAREATERLEVIEEPLLALRDDLKGLHLGIEADSRVLEDIQEAVRQAREHEE
jgi:hypothetical protein